MSGERSDLKVVKINIDDNQEQALQHNVLLLPTVMLFVEGNAVGKLQGGVPPTAIARMLEENLPAPEPSAAGDGAAVTADETAN